METMSAASEEILLAGLDDWVQACEVDWAVGGAGPSTKEERLAAAIEVVGQLLRAGLMEIGDVLVGKGFVPWSLDIDAALTEVQLRWMALEEEHPRLGDVCWLNLTPRGEEAARKLLDTRRL
jgi:hypothetical protein